jgi:LPS O-antigen subunit length determinant protein (WzzB/FepE family)
VAKYAEVKLALQQILEEQYKKLALAQTREEYALRYIESPMLAVKKSGPKRAIICIAITIIGTTLSLFFWWSLRILRS